MPVLSRLAGACAILPLVVAGMTSACERTPGWTDGELDGSRIEVADAGHVFDIDLSHWPRDLAEMLGERALIVVSDRPLSCNTASPLPPDGTALQILVAMVRPDYAYPEPYDPENPDGPRLETGRYDEAIVPGLGGIPRISPEAEHVHWPGLRRGEEAVTLSGWTELIRVDRRREHLAGELELSRSEDDGLVGAFSSRPCPGIDFLVPGF